MKLKKEFEEFHDSIKVTNTEELKEKREMFENEIKDNLPSILSDHNITVNKSDISFFTQGSYATRTMVDTGGDIDIDLAISFPLDININNDCRIIKGYVRDSVDSYNRSIEIKKPCITVNYQKDIHVDLPVYAIYNDGYYLAVGKENADNFEWQKCDPKGLNSYFNDFLSYNDQLRRIIRYIKKWKSLKFNNDNEMPPSIAMTILACEYYEKKQEDGKDDDLTALYSLVTKIWNLLPMEDDPKLEVYLPKLPYTDTMFKINNNSEYRKKFKNKLCYLKNQLSNALNSSDDHTASTYLQKIFGDEFPIHEKETDELTSNKYRSTGHFG